MDHFDYCIVGAGVIGLALAHKLSLKYPNASILVLEKAPLIGSETSSRNSEVIHAGIYYPEGSLKAQLCLQGREALYEFCQRYRVNVRQTGKLIVANDESELDNLFTLQKKADNNGVKLDVFSQQKLQQLEPQVKGIKALYSPRTGIIDSHSFMQTLQTLAEQQGVLFSLNTELICARQNNRQGFTIRVNSSAQEFEFHSSQLINCAGIYASEVAARIESDTSTSFPQTHFCIGHYFSYQGRSPFKHLIYPMPGKNLHGLGIHATLDLGGQCRFGPDSQYIDNIDYQFDEQRKNTFVSAIKRYFPALEAERLQPAYTGIRPKLSLPGEAAADFRIENADDHGVSGLIQCFGIESPGLTSSLALADYIIGDKLEA